MTLKEKNKFDTSISVLWDKEGKNFRKSYITKDINSKDINGNNVIIPNQLNQLLADIGQAEYDKLKLGV